MSDLSIYGNLLARPKSIAENAAQFGQIQQNALAMQAQQEQLNALQRQAAADASYSEAVKGFGPDTSANAAALRAKGLGAQALAYEKSALEQQKMRTDMEQSKSVADKNNAETKRKQYEQAIVTLTKSRSPQEAIANINAGVSSGHWSMKDAQQKISEIPSGDPAAYEDWRRRELIGVMGANDALTASLPKATETRLGDRVALLDTNPASATFGKPISTQKMGISPDTVYQGGISRANNRDTITAENARAAQGVTYQQDASGNLIALPTKINGGSGSVSPVPVMAGGQQMQGKGSPRQQFANQYAQLNGVIDEVKQLLPKATASGAGALRDATVGFFGASTDAGDAAAKLETLGGWLASNVPRFEGPQSDKDTAQYRMMAGDVGNKKLPVSQRLQKLDALKNFMDAKAATYGIQSSSQGQSAGQNDDPIAAELARRGHK